MKGKSIFTASEINELRLLISKRTKAERSAQKSIRAKMRKIGFYGSDFGITDLQLSDFERLVSSGLVKTSNQVSTPAQSHSSITIPSLKNHQEEHSKEQSNDRPLQKFRLFDPQVHSEDKIPNSPGNYIVCLRKSSSLPDIGMSYETSNFEGFEIIYTGIAGTSLRQRDYRQHFNGNNAGRSTLRKSIGSMFGYKFIPRDKDPSTGKTKFSDENEIFLSKWMNQNLVMFYMPNLNPSEEENLLIKQLNPPLNLSKNKNAINSEFRKVLSTLRNRRIGE